MSQIDSMPSLFRSFLRLSADAFLLGGALVLAGCRTIEPRADLRTFEYPFVDDYSVVNRATFSWQDEFLSASSDIYSQDLAGPLAALSGAVYGYHLEMDVHSLEGLGFDRARMVRCYGKDLNYQDPVYGLNLVGFTLATKRVLFEGVPRDVIFIVLRGTFGRDEWVSNMNVCNTWGAAENPDPAAIPALHEGFRLAADQVENALVAFVRTNNLDLASAKVVITGHSRGAAVANILGARLDDAAQAKGRSPFAALSRQNVFVYTFASPNTVLRTDVDVRSPRYGNIFNVINPEDIVPRVPIARWQARRFGRDLHLLDYDSLSLWGLCWNDAYGDMKDAVKEMCGYEWWHLPFGTNSVCAVPTLLGNVAPTLVDLYAIPPGQRQVGHLTSVQSIVEHAIYRAVSPTGQDDWNTSLGRDVANLSEVFRLFEHPLEKSIRNQVFYYPDGHDFSRQPGMFNFVWRIICTHAPATYIGWMKSAEKNGPASVFTNWSDRDSRSLTSTTKEK